MAIEWGSWEGASPTRIRVGLDVSWEAVDHGEATATATIKGYVDVEGNWSDDQKVTLGGSANGSASFTNNQNNSQALRITDKYDYDYPSSSYGSSPGSKTFSISLSGAFNGATPSKSVTKNIPSRPYDRPAPTTSLSATRISDASTKISWVNHATAGEPYSGIEVQRYVYPYGTYAGGDWADIANVSGSATSFTYSSYANRKFNFRTLPSNSEGIATAYEYNGFFWTSPAAPGSCVRTTVGADEKITWDNTVLYSEHSTEVWHAANGVWDAAPLATVGSGVETYTHVAPSASIKHKYKVRCRTTSAPATLYSAFTADTTETAGVSTPPLAPTNLTPTDLTIINPTQTRDLTWQYNSSDLSAQTGFGIQWRVQGAGSWNVLADTASALSKWTAPSSTFPDNSTIEWQVKTKGTNAAYGPYSASALFQTVGDPNARREQTRVMRMNLETGTQETATVGVLPPIGSMMEFAGIAAPAGWLLCQGQSLLRADYTDLFGVIGTAYGAVDSTHFNVPDRRDRTGVGASATKALGSTGGSETTVIPQVHNHITPNHTHTDNYGTASTTGTVARQTSTGSDNATGTAHTHAVTGGITSSGSGTTGGSSIANPTVNVQNPYIAFNYIIKA
jgi:microcystin-dependent protein